MDSFLQRLAAMINKPSEQHFDLDEAERQHRRVSAPDIHRRNQNLSADRFHPKGSSSDQLAASPRLTFLRHNAPGEFFALEHLCRHFRSLPIDDDDVFNKTNVCVFSNELIRTSASQPPSFLLIDGRSEILI